MGLILFLWNFICFIFEKNTHMGRILLNALVVSLIMMSGCSSGKLDLNSPSGKLSLTVIPGSRTYDSAIAEISLKRGKKVIFPASPVFLKIEEKHGDAKVKLISFETDSVRNSWENNFGERKNIPDNYNQLKLILSAGSLKINLICRAYDEGIAFSWEIPAQDSIKQMTVKDEKILYRFAEDYTTWSAARAQAKYSKVPLSRIEKDCERPLVVEYDSTLTIALGEAALVDFPRMKFRADTSSGVAIRSILHEKAVRTLPFRSPWRYVIAGDNPGDLLEKNYLLLNLNEPSRISDVSWIRPGKVLREVTLTTKGGKEAVDFTASHNMQYVEFDAGWYGPENNDASDAKGVHVDPARSKGPLDLKEVIKYAKSKNIGILLYVNRRALERQIDTILPIFRDWGVSGIKFGFVQVGTQKYTAWLHESIKKAAAYNMVVDVHDEYRPTGFSRTYPNFLTQEGIRGDEESPENSHTLTTMFTRMIAGAGDNTVCYYNERVEKKMGSHASQLAKTVCLFSPLQFLYWYDRAINIGTEPELEFFNNVPTVWDETKVLHGKIGEYGMIARKKGDEWFVGGINGSTPHSLNVDFSFLDSGKTYLAKIYSDDPEVDTKTHVRIDSIQIDNKSEYKATLKVNNGIAMHIAPIK
jgi:alpha-glucosidase